MRIDPLAEVLGRGLVVAFIARDPDRAEKALDAIVEAPDATSAQVVTLYAQVARTSLLAIYQGRLPNEEQNRSFARKVVASETWAPTRENSIFEVLRSLSSASGLTVAPAEAVAVLFLTLGYILAIYCEPLGYATTYEFLDACLEQIERL